MASVIQYILYLAVLVILAIPLGAYIKRVMYGEKTFLSKILSPCENLVYKVMRVDKEEQMSWKKYLLSVLIFNGIGLVFLFLLQLLQGVLPGNPQGLSGVKWDLSFNTAVSFVTNTNWQAYSGESTLSYLTQALGLTVQNFVSAATGIAVLFALIRGFVKVKTDGLGSFWVDMTRIVIHVLIPLNLVISLCLVGGGVIQNLKGAETVALVEPIAVSDETFALDTDHNIIENAEIDTENGVVTVDGVTVSSNRSAGIRLYLIYSSVSSRHISFSSEVFSAIYASFGCSPAGIASLPIRAFRSSSQSLCSGKSRYT